MLAPRPDGVPHFGPPSGLDFGGFWSNPGSMLGPSWRYLGALGHKRWHWMGWWGYAKRKELPISVILLISRIAGESAGKLDRVGIPRPARAAASAASRRVPGSRIQFFSTRFVER